MKGIKGNLNTWRNLPGLSCIGRLGVVKIPIVPKLIYGLYTIPTHISASLFVEIGKFTLKLIRKEKSPRISQNHFEN